MPNIQDVSVFVALTPLASISLALNLAYLNLEKFRYLKIIEAAGKDVIDENTITHDFIENHCETSDQKQKASYLTSLATLTTRQTKPDFPKTKWVWKVRLFYSSSENNYSLDILASTFAAIVAVGVVLLGGLHNADIVACSPGSWTNMLASCETGFWLATIVYLFTAVGTLLPVFLIWAGRSAVRATEEFMDQTIGQLLKGKTGELLQSVDTENLPKKTQITPKNVKRFRQRKRAGAPWHFVPSCRYWPDSGDYEEVAAAPEEGSYCGICLKIAGSGAA